MRPAITFLNIQLSNSRLSAPVKKGSCAGAIYYKLGGMVLREYQVETTEDMEKLDFEWCLRQVLKLAV